MVVTLQSGRKDVAYTNNLPSETGGVAIAGVMALAFVVTAAALGMLPDLTLHVMRTGGTVPGILFVSTVLTLALFGAFAVTVATVRTADAALRTVCALLVSAVLTLALFGAFAVIVAAVRTTDAALRTVGTRFVSRGSL